MTYTNAEYDFDLISEFASFGVPEDLAFDYIAAGLWPSEVRGYLESGLTSISAMKSFASLGLSGEVAGLLHGVGITSLSQKAQLAGADEDWFTLHTAISNGLRTFEELKFVVDRKVSAQMIKDVAALQDVSEESLAAALSDAAGLSDKEKELAIALTQQVFLENAPAILRAHMYPFHLVDALSRPVVTFSVFSAVAAETSCGELVALLPSLPTKVVRQLAILCQGTEELSPEEIWSLLGILLES